MYNNKLKIQYGDFTVTDLRGILHMDPSGTQLCAGVYHSPQSDRFAVELSPATRGEATGVDTFERHLGDETYAAMARNIAIDGADTESGVSLRGLAAIVELTRRNVSSIWGGDATPKTLQTLQQHFGLGDFMR